MHMKCISFLTLDTCFHILVALIGSMSFVKSFVVEALQEDFNIIVNLLMFENLQATLEFFLFSYAWCLGYLLYIVFSSPSMLQHYAKFDSHIVNTLERLLGVGSLSVMVGHLGHQQVTLLASSWGLASFQLFDLFPLLS